MTQLERLEIAIQNIESANTKTLLVIEGDSIKILGVDNTNLVNLNDYLPNFKADLLADLKKELDQLKEQDRINNILINLHNLYSEDLTVIETAFENLKQQEGVDILQIETTLQNLLNSLNNDTV